MLNTTCFSILNPPQVKVLFSTNFALPLQTYADAVRELSLQKEKCHKVLVILGDSLISWKLYKKKASRTFANVEYRELASLTIEFMWVFFSLHLFFVIIKLLSTCVAIQVFTGNPKTLKLTIISKGKRCKIEQLDQFMLRQLTNQLIS